MEGVQACGLPVEVVAVIAIEHVDVYADGAASMSEVMHVVAKGLIPLGITEKITTSHDQHRVTARRQRFACRLFTPRSSRLDAMPEGTA